MRERNSGQQRPPPRRIRPAVEEEACRQQYTCRKQLQKYTRGRRSARRAALGLCNWTNEIRLETDELKPY